MSETRPSKYYTEGADFYPHELELFEADLAAFVREYVLPGHVPSEKPLARTDRIVTLGSCFANNLRLFLDRIGSASDNFWIPDALTTTHAMLEFISWCVTGQASPGGFQYRVNELESAADRDEILEHLRGTAAYVLTFGLAELWEDRDTGQVFWRGIPKVAFNEDRHRFRVTSPEENTSNIVRIIELIRNVSPEAPIVLTLSPVPLKATFRDISCLTADCVSKATLRVALDRVMAERHPNVYYWPSFEIVRWIGAHRSRPAFGVGARDARHVDESLIALIVDLFVESFYRQEDAVHMARTGREAPAA